MEISFMDTHFTYLLIDAGIISVPLLFSFNKKLAFYKYWRSLWPGLIMTCAVFICSDIFFLTKGIWWFNDSRVLPFRLLGVPLEECLFFIFLSYFCAFVEACMDVWFPPRGQANSWRVCLQLAVVLILVGALNYTRAYALASFAGCGFALIVAWALRKKNPAFRADRFLLTYAIYLIPFLIINGLLTGLPIILYNDAENIGVHIYTIPLENIFYGMLLALGNIWGMKRASEI